MGHYMSQSACVSPFRVAAGGQGSPIILGPYQRAYEPNTIFIPVHRWSDGSPGPK